jgi:hypothetical protein
LKRAADGVVESTYPHDAVVGPLSVITAAPAVTARIEQAMYSCTKRDQGSESLAWSLETLEGSLNIAVVPTPSCLG